jgi:acyl-CoA synthetase (NDP forming)
MPADLTGAPLKRFFAPRAAALVGATPDLSKFGGRCLRQRIDFGFAGDLFPVNPRYQELGWLRCFGNIRDLPVAPDHVGIVVPAERVLSALEDCAARGVPFATVFTSGFAETGTDRGREMQRDVAAIARRSGMRIMGPNCNGLINFVDAFALTSTATITGPRKAPGPLGVVAHSGGVGQVNVKWRAQELGLGVGYEVSSGNDADLDVLDFADFMLEDETIRVALLVAARAYKPDARLYGVLVQEMVQPGVETILGVAPDPVFGPVIVAGLGGIHVEVLRDVAHRIPPVDMVEARSMLDDLRGAPILRGVRGMPPRDIDALCDRIARLSWLAHDLPQIAELDINPLMLGAQGEGALVVDAPVKLA